MTARPHRTRTLALTSTAGVTLLLAACSSGSATAPVPSTPATSTSAVASLTPAPSTPGASATGPTASLTTTTRVPTTPAGPSVATAAVGGGGDSGVRLELVLARTSAAGSRTVTVTATTRGLVHQYVSAVGGTVIPAATAEVMGTRVTWGDGSAPGGSDAGDVQCSATTRLVPVHQTFTEKHTYARPGHYTVTFTAGACAPLHTVSRTLPVTVR